MVRNFFCVFEISRLFGLHIIVRRIGRKVVPGKSPGEINARIAVRKGVRAVSEPPAADQQRKPAGKRRNRLARIIHDVHELAA
jgi:hypothetical protein